jgi:hypothetical protein
MDEHSLDSRQSSLEERSRALFRESVDGLDMRMRSRLTQARHAALDAAAASRRRPLFFRIALWRPAAGVTAAALLGVALWFGSPLGHHGSAAVDNQSSLEDLEIIASSDESSGDAMEMLQDDIEFYDWADKDANPGPAA